jgi:hypothetical protein
LLSAAIACLKKSTISSSCSAEETYIAFAFGTEAKDPLVLPRPAFDVSLRQTLLDPRSPLNAEKLGACFVYPPWEALWATFPAPLEACVIYIGTVLALRRAQGRSHIGPTRGSGTWANSASKACPHGRTRSCCPGTWTRIGGERGLLPTQPCGAVAARPKTKRAFEVAFIPTIVGQAQRARRRKGKTASASFDRASTTVANLSQCNRLMAKSGTMRTLISRKSTRRRTRT